MAPVIFEVRLCVSVDHEVAFDQLIENMNAAASRVGRASSIEVATVEAQSDVAARRVSVTFANNADLASWLASTEHASFVTRLEPMLFDRYQTAVRTGMESWVPSPGVRAPKRWKSATVTFVGLFPLLSVLRLVSDALQLGALGPIAALALTVAISCTAMTWIVMPGLTTALGGWLDN